MCGISTLISFDGFNVSPFILPMNEQIRHRGPDDEGYAFIREKEIFIVGGKDTPGSVYKSDSSYTPEHSIEKWGSQKCKIAMGHRRLSIIDPSPKGHQPMITPDGRFVIVYNGEVYNYVELREKLKTKGYQFISDTDTEVILAAYNVWGPECLNRFIGMFSFVIFDIGNENIFAARDRFGVKPFYYWFSPKGFLAFASEIKQFTTLPGWKARLNHSRAYDFLSRCWIDHTRETLFSDVFQLRGGEYIHCSISDINRSLPIKKWYELKPKETNFDFDISSEYLKDLFYKSIRLHLRADVPIGTGLSGGLDSSSIVCVINEILCEIGTQTLQNTFSSCSEFSEYDERPFIEEVVRQTKVKTHYIFPSLDKLFEESEAIAWYQDEPYSSTSIYAEWNVYKTVAINSVKATLEGHGADELFFGYPVFFKIYLQSLLAEGRVIQMIREFLKIRKVHRNQFQKMLVNGLKSLILGPGKTNHAFKSSWIKFNEYQNEEYDPLKYLSNDKAAHNISRLQFLHTSLPSQLHWADRNSMAHSVECRLPYLDHRLVEFVLGCPDIYKIGDGITKRILRESLKNKIPTKILKRTDKMGYVTPEEIWVKKEAPEAFMKAVQTALEQSKGVFNSDLVLKSASKIIFGTSPYDTALWRVISFGTWMNRFFND